jgi:hypothetical protein
MPTVTSFAPELLGRPGRLTGAGGYYRTKGMSILVLAR